jgi:HD-GYP domain-containing protein (c-di-GMP phosphodiesterase class II)
MIGPVMATRPIASNAKPATSDPHELARLEALRAYRVLDTKPEAGFDDLAALAASLCRAPLALIGFLDAERYWVKAQVGLKLEAVPRDYALFQPNAHTELEEIPDTQAGSRLAEHPMVLLWPKVRFYASVPVVSTEGQLLGAVEVMDQAPRHLDDQQRQGLQTIARQVVAQLELRRTADEMERRTQQATADMNAAFDATLESMARALDLRDRETDGHLARVAQITVRLAKAMHVPEDQLVHIRRGALLHDIGKMGIPDGILLKPSALNDEEWGVMHLHPTYAFEMLSPIEILRPALDIPHCHHERWDGQGYPRGLRHEEIPLAARIFSVVDVWDALRSDRPYRAGWTEARVRDYLSKRSGADFDPAVVEQFLKMPTNML